MYGAEWLIGLGVLGLLAGVGAGYLLATRTGPGGSRARELEAQLAAARQELDDYRQQVVAEFSETARKFQTLNDSYTDLHQQLARSSQVLCGDITGPLLEAPQGHQDLIPAEIRNNVEALAAGAAASTEPHAEATDTGTGTDTPAARSRATEGAAPETEHSPPQTEDEIRVSEPRTAAAEAAASAAAQPDGDQGDHATGQDPYEDPHPEPAKTAGGR